MRASAISVSLLLGATVLHFVATGVAVHFISSGGGRWADVINSDADPEGRNESSTPRSLILPPSPAVAKIQENRSALKAAKVESVACLGRLGFQADQIDLEDPLSDPVAIRAIGEFQRSINLLVTGVMDVATASALRCVP